MIDRESLLEFDPYVNLKYKGISLQEIVFIAKQGEEEAKEEYFARIQNVLMMLSKYYSKQSGLLIEDFLHEFYVCAHKALVSYQNDQGDFERFLRCYLSNGAKWYIARSARRKKDDARLFCIGNYDDGHVLNIENTYADPDSPTILRISEKLDNEKYIQYAMEYIDSELDERNRNILLSYLYDDCTNKEIAMDYNISFSGVYRHIRNIIKSLNKYVIKREKEEAIKNILKNIK